MANNVAWRDFMEWNGVPFVGNIKTMTKEMFTCAGGCNVRSHMRVMIVMTTVTNAACAKTPCRSVGIDSTSRMDIVVIRVASFLWCMHRTKRHGPKVIL